MGSLYTAVASYLDARHRRGSWLLRIDDLDTPRNVPGATSRILACLKQFGLHWDGDVYLQSQQSKQYGSRLSELQQKNKLYACRCSRKKLAGKSIYPGYCREAGWPQDDSCALRLKCEDCEIAFDDGLQGLFQQNLAKEQGDFIVRRRDQIIAYQFAVVVDDFLQGVTHVVRGLDLLDSTPKQIFLQTLFGYPTPHYLHLPLIVDPLGEKLSKQTLAKPVDDSNPSKTLFQILQLLQQNPPDGLRDTGVNIQLSWAIEHWQPQALKKMRAIQSPIL